jgi:hypothetical protein
MVGLVISLDVRPNCPPHESFVGNSDSFCWGDLGGEWILDDTFVSVDAGPESAILECPS